jgi:hypothetical protein
MKRWSVLLFVLFLVAVTPMAQGAGKKSWVALFDGKDLNGWTNNGQEKWVAEKGTILGESTAG